jgi:anthranilate synthase/aminodeoxychorismate synthase-like glutamine amidotransferase
VRVLLVDNYDSFTYNLVQLLRGDGHQVEVVRNDARSADALLAGGAEAVVLSPGPGRPEEAGVCVELLRRRAPLAVLGVCLGHQALGVAFGATVGRAPRLMHGKTSEITHDGGALFAGVPSPFVATRYHSLEVRDLPGELAPLAHGDDGTLMAMRHRELPYFGVQFHPESVLTPAGPQLLRNFVAIASQTGHREARRR